MSHWPRASLRHLANLTDEVGVVEHACFDQPSPRHGYCTDDAGRLLALASCLATDPAAHSLALAALDFLERAHRGVDLFRLRWDESGHWRDDGPSDDAIGRALCGLGVATLKAPWPGVRRASLELFEATMGFESEHPRALAYATVGAVAVLGAHENHEGARRIARCAEENLPGLSANPAWPWPETRLSYANALVPGARLISARALGSRVGVDDALAQLDWLVRHETAAGYFSFTPVGGWAPGDPRPGFDQQPIEAAAMSFACFHAYVLTTDPYWARAVTRAADWFVGVNDAGRPMFDERTGGGFDGLEARGVNLNQGAESTMAYVTTMALANDLERFFDAPLSLLAAGQPALGHPRGPDGERPATGIPRSFPAVRAAPVEARSRDGVEPRRVAPPVSVPAGPQSARLTDEAPGRWLRWHQLDLSARERRASKPPSRPTDQPGGAPEEGGETGARDERRRR